MITVIGKRVDTEKYIDKPGYNVLARRDDWTPTIGREWLIDAVERGDEIMIVSPLNVSGQFRQELLTLFGALNLECSFSELENLM